MWFEEGADIDVEGKTYLEGGAIVSEQEGGLLLSTGELEVADLAINDYADDTYVGGQVNVNVGNVVTGKGDVFTENTYGSVEHSEVGHEKEGIIKGTISGGSVTVGGTRDDEGNIQGGEVLDTAALEDMGINTDADNIITITKDESWEESFKVDLVNVGVVAEQVDNLVNVVESLTAKVPDHVKAMGDSAEDLYRKAIANGMERGDLEALTQTEGFQNAVDFRNRLENQYEQGEVTAEYIYTQMAVEAKAFADGYMAKNCASGTAEICDKLLNIYGNGKTAEELTSDDIFALMQAIEASTMAGDSVDDEGNRLWGSALMQAAADCSALWYKDLRTREGDIAADQKIKDDIQSGQFQEILEKSGVDPMQYLVDTGFDMKLKTDPSTHSQVENIMKMTNKNDQADEFVKMLVKLDGNGKPIVQNGKYVLDDEKQKNLLQSMVFYAGDTRLKADTWDALSSALYVAGVDFDDYQEKDIVEALESNRVPINFAYDNNGVNDLANGVDLNMFGPLQFGELTLKWEKLKKGTGGNANSNIWKYPNRVTVVDSNDYILGDFMVGENVTPEYTININEKYMKEKVAYPILGHELLHVRQFENIYNLIEYGRDSKGNLVADDCLNQASCRGTLWQYVNMKRGGGGTGGSYSERQVAVTMPNGQKKAYYPYKVSPIELWPQQVYNGTSTVPRQIFRVVK